jgi:hypothetical protein
MTVLGQAKCRTGRAIASTSTPQGLHFVKSLLRFDIKTTPSLSLTELTEQPGWAGFSQWFCTLLRKRSETTSHRAFTEENYSS